MRQYVNEVGKVRWFATDEDHITHEAQYWSRIPTPEKAREQLDLAALAAGEPINLEEADIGVAVPDGLGGFRRIRIAWDGAAGEWKEWNG